MDARPSWAERILPDAIHFQDLPVASVMGKKTHTGMLQTE
jgi:hypothetical protein